MSSLLKTTVLSLGLLAGAAAVAHAQSVTSLPPSGPATAPTVTTPSPSTADKWQHPYSPSVGPQPGSHNSGKDEHYQATEEDNAPSRHPYTGNLGPRPH